MATIMERDTRMTKDAVVDRELLTVQQVAEYLQLNPATVRKWLREGRLAGIHFGGVAGWRIRREDLQRFIDQQKKGGQ
jgi:excisionase family DNA binding protein